MKKVSWGPVVLAVLGLGLIPGPSKGDAGQIAVYFDTLRTMRAADSPGLGQVDILYVFGEDFPIGLVGAAQYAIDYGPHLTLIADTGLPPVSIGNSDTGISVGFDLPGRGKAFFIQKAVVQWDIGDCSDPNSDYPRVVEHPSFPDPTPIITEFGTVPPLRVFPAFGARSQTCQFVGLDIRPGEWPNAFDSTLWDTTSVSDRKGGALPVAILGSATVDVHSIDVGSCRLEGVSPITVGVMDCACSDLGSDGFDDLFLQFLSRDVAAAIDRGNPGDTPTLTLTGAYNDGMPFSASDRVVVVATDGGSPPPSPALPTVVLGLPTPNPFNPVTKIAFSVPVAQHVRLAVYDVAGRLLETLVDEVKDAGDYVIEWNAGNLSSGVYFHRLQTASGTVVRRATLIK
jgi:hypothetical protein